MTLDGRWDITLTSPLGERRGQLDLHTDGDSLSGTFRSQGNDHEFNGQMHDGDFTWVTTIDDGQGPIQIQWHGRMKNEGEIEGQAEMGEYGHGDFTGRRAS